jgi:hypothetical protein
MPPKQIGDRDPNGKICVTGVAGHAESIAVMPAGNADERV